MILKSRPLTFMTSQLPLTWRRNCVMIDVTTPVDIQILTQNKPVNENQKVCRRFVRQSWCMRVLTTSSVSSKFRRYQDNWYSIKGRANSFPFSTLSKTISQLIYSTFNTVNPRDCFPGNRTAITWSWPLTFSVESKNHVLVMRLYSVLLSYLSFLLESV